MIKRLFFWFFWILGPLTLCTPLQHTLFLFWSTLFLFYTLFPSFTKLEKHNPLNFGHNWCVLHYTTTATGLHSSTLFFSRSILLGIRKCEHIWHGILIIHYAWVYRGEGRASCTHFGTFDQTLKTWRRAHYASLLWQPCAIWTTHSQASFIVHVFSFREWRWRSQILSNNRYAGRRGGWQHHYRPRLILATL